MILISRACPKQLPPIWLLVRAGRCWLKPGQPPRRQNLRAQLAAHGYEPGDIRHVLVTHIHLDHAGSAGWLAQQGAQIYVHHVGAPHLIDPAKLLASAGRIYGDQMDSLWGQTVPAPADKVTPISDGDVVEVAGLKFTALDTPGHAWHHHCYRLEDVIFTGDAAGVRLTGTQVIDLPAPPPEFKLEVWQQTIDRLLAEPFSAIYPTHFGRIEDGKWQLTALRELMQNACEFVRGRLQAGVERDEIVADYTAWMHQLARENGADAYTIAQYETANPSYMSVDGILRYWQRKKTT